MEYDIDFDSAGPFDVVVKTSGVLDPDELSRGRDKVFVDPRFRPGMNILIDHTGVEVGETITADIRRTAESAARRYPDSGFGLLAIVVPHRLGYGLGRMWQLLTSEEVADRSVIVESVAEANAWLEEQPSASG